MKRLLSIVALVVVALLLSCGNREVVRDTEPVYTPRYAQGFSIEHDKANGELLLCVKNPWQGAENIIYYTPLNTEKPIERVVAMSSSHTAMLEAMGCAERIVGISGCRFISSPTIVKAIEEGKIAEVGYDSAFDFERIKSLRADMVMLYGIAGEAKTLTNKFDELSIPYIYIGDYLETSPLGKAEWIIALGYLCGCEEESKKFFDGVEARYNALRESVSSTTRPRVMLNLPYRDTWFMPSNESYIVRLIEDAAGEYIYPQNNTKSSVPISLEEALVLASRSDFWLNFGAINSLDELKSAAPRFVDVKAVREGRLYNNTKRTNNGGGSDFWESGAVRPDLILNDLVHILHHEATTEELYYYRQLQ